MNWTCDLLDHGEWGTEVQKQIVRVADALLEREGLSNEKVEEISEFSGSLRPNTGE